MAQDALVVTLLANALIRAGVITTRMEVVNMIQQVAAVILSASATKISLITHHFTGME